MDFISDIVGTDLYERDDYNRDVPAIKLVELDGYTDPMEAAEHLVGQLESLPWLYTLSIELPAKVSEFFRNLDQEIQLSDNVRLIATTEELNQRFPLSSANEKRQNRIHQDDTLLSSILATEPKWNEEAAYIQIGVEGFVGRYGNTMSADRAKNLLRAICGLAIAIRVLKVNSSHNLVPLKSHFWVHRHFEQGAEIDGKFELDDHHAVPFNSLEVHNLNGKLENELQQQVWVKGGLSDIAQVLTAQERGERILLASQWLFDSYATKDELLAFVQTMVVLEILLGDENVSGEMGLGQLLRNRCAYLIGATHNQRTELLQDFDRIYTVRSKIVHRGKSRLTAQERVLFNKLRWMCRRVIQEEVNLLKADTEEAVQ